MQRNATPLSWYPKGVSDTLDATESFPGAMASLSNLILDPSTPKLWQCRPAAIEIGAIGGVRFISAMKIVGSSVYGMVASAVHVGFDDPFCFDLLSNTFVAVSGVTSANIPTSPATSGAWTPPIMDVIGSKIIVTHSGFGATANFFGWFDISTPTAPVWHAGNLTGAITLSTIPTFVAQFNGRAYFIVNTVAQPAVVFSDPLNPTNVTNATQVLTFGDAVFLTAMGQLRLYNQAGGIIQGLIVFKGVSNCYQITGDSALNNLAVNALNVATGTLAPLTITATKAGLAFVSPDGLRVIDFMGNVSDPIGVDGEGVTLPFIYSSVPSRMCAAANGNVLRISTQNGNALNNPFQEWWFDIPRKVWTGPHTFPASLIQPYQNTFIVVPVVRSSLWQSDTVQSATSLFVEDVTQLTWVWETAFFPNTKKMNNVAVSQALLDIALSSSAPPVNVSAVDPNGFVFDSVTLAISGAATTWGAFTWGSAVWGAPQGALLPRQLQWHQPIVFAKMAVEVSGQSNSAIKIGAVHMRYKMLRYLQDIGAVA